MLQSLASSTCPEIGPFPLIGGLTTMKSMREYVGNGRKQSRSHTPKDDIIRASLRVAEVRCPRGSESKFLILLI